jgi:catechol 2,3-dioxygenase-like lactoylglutathione lyase family enzyme
MAQNIAIERVDHIGVRVRNLDRALAFYRVLGFAVVHRAEGDDVAIIRNEHGVELNLVFNANAGDPATNILMDVREKFPGYTHIALRVASRPTTAPAPRPCVFEPRDLSGLLRFAKGAPSGAPFAKSAPAKRPAPFSRPAPTRPSRSRYETGVGSRVCRPAQ